VCEADNLPPYSADVKKTRSLNSPRPLWACMACNGCALPLLLLVKTGVEVADDMFKQDRQFTCNGTLRRVPATIVTVECNEDYTT
jgi:hypothetical protein